MKFDNPKYMNVFFELHHNLPREGPGCREATLRALNGTKLPESPRVLDVGCGPGMQTIDLAMALPKATFVAVDSHQGFLDQLNATAVKQGFTDRIETRRADMNALPFEDSSFDLIWSEGAAYIMGVEQALNQWRRLLKNGGFLALTEATWLKSNPPAELKNFWLEYPGMKDLSGNLGLFERCGYQVADHFLLPETAWMDNYYLPIEAKLSELSKKFGSDEVASQVIKESEHEIAMFRKYSDYYGYAFFVTKLSQA